MEQGYWEGNSIESLLVLRGEAKRAEDLAKVWAYYYLYREVHPWKGNCSSRTSNTYPFGVQPFVWAFVKPQEMSQP